MSNEVILFITRPLGDRGALNTIDKEEGLRAQGSSDSLVKMRPLEGKLGDWKSCVTCCSGPKPAFRVLEQLGVGNPSVLPRVSYMCCGAWLILSAS